MNNQDAINRPVLGGVVFLTVFYRLIRTARIYDDNNSRINEAVSQFVKIVRQLCVDEDLAINVTLGRFYMQGEKLLYRSKDLRLIHDMLDFFEKRGLAGLCFAPGIKEAPIKEITSFARIIDRSIKKEHPLSWLIKEMDTKDYSWVEIIQETGPGFQERDSYQKQRAVMTYSYTLASVKEVAQKISQQSPAGVRKIRRMAQSLVEFISDDEALLLGLSTLRDYDDYTFNHSVNVALLAVCLGKRIGLSRASLVDLAISGLFHDLGKVEVSKDILYKRDSLNDEEWEEMRKHPLLSVRQILKLHAPRELKLGIVLAPFEHHLMYDLSGYPHVDFKKSISLFGRILTIVDVYDSLTSPRRFRPEPYSPDKVLAMMSEKAGKDFDANLLRVFFNMMGVYPVGTLVHLNTGEIGLVMDYPNRAEKKRPRIVLLVEDGRGGLERGEVVNIAEQNPYDGTFKRNIVKGLNPSSYGIQPASFLI